MEAYPRYNCCCFSVEVFVAVANQLGTRYITTRFNTDKETWPPNQSKHFTTLAFIYHNNKRTQEQVITMAQTTIDEIMVSADKQKCGDSYYYCFEGSRATKSISELLAPLDHVDSSHQRTILIEGAPGIGKSFLLKHIAYLWAKKEVLTSSKLLFLLCLRDPVVQKMSSINDLIDYFCKQERTALTLGHLCAAHLYKTGGKDVTILLDGFDELPEDLQDGGFITGLLEHHVLPLCNIIVSSRPHASAHLHNDVLLRVDILGFTEEDRECFIKESLKGQPRKATTLLEYLKNHPTVSSLCFVPFIMTVLLFLYKQGINLFHSPTEFYKHFVCFTVCRHLAKSGIRLQEDITDLNYLPDPYKDIIKSLSKFSFKALSENQLIFTLEEVKTACPKIKDIPGAINGFGLLQAVEHFSVTTTTLTFNFIHFSIQEFLAAHYIANLSPEKECKIIKKCFWSKFHLNMFSMYVGITKGQHSSFKQFLCGNNDVQTGIAEKFLTDHIKCFQLYKYFNEAGDSEMCKLISEAVVSSDKIINLRGIPMLPTEVNCLGLFLTKSHIKHWKRVELLGCNIRDIGCQILHRALVGQIEPITIDYINFSSNSLTSTSTRYISDIVVACKAKLLHLNGNTLGETNSLASMVQNSVLEELYINGNMLHTSTAISIFKALQSSNQLKTLSLTCNNIQKEASDEIMAALQVNKSLQSLWIHANPLCKEAALKLVSALKNNSTLNLLKLPSYSCEVRKLIAKEVKDINKYRKSHNQKMYVELTVDFQ